MTILAALQSAAVRLVGQRPGAFFSASGQIERELSDLVNEVAEDVAKYHDWQALVRVCEIVGDGTTTEFNLPPDYDRMLVKSDMSDPASWFWGYGHYTDINAFLRDEARGFNPGGWIIYDDHLRFSPAPSSGQKATFPYITKNWATAESLAPKSSFTADTDNFRLPERLLTLGLVWRWRENKGLDATGDQEAFVKALDEYATKDGGSRTFRRNSRRYLAGTQVAWPWQLG